MFFRAMRDIIGPPDQNPVYAPVSRVMYIVLYRLLREEGVAAPGTKVMIYIIKKLFLYIN